MTQAGSLSNRRARKFATFRLLLFTCPHSVTNLSSLHRSIVIQEVKRGASARLQEMIAADQHIVVGPLTAYALLGKHMLRTMDDTGAYQADSHSGTTLFSTSLESGRVPPARIQSSQSRSSCAAADHTRAVPAMRTSIRPMNRWTHRSGMITFPYFGPCFAIIFTDFSLTNRPPIRIM